MRQRTDGTLFNKRQRRDVGTKFQICFLGVFFSFCGYRTVIDLQTSINIQEGLGSAAGTASYVACVLSSFTIAPTLLKIQGPRNCLILSEIFYLIFVIANFYPIFATLVTASILTGVAESICFPAISLYCVGCATIYTKYTNKDVTHCVVDFTGKAFGVVYAARVSGSLISYVVMQTETRRENSTSNNNHDLIKNGTIYEFCGSNDCQDPNITANSLSNYVTSKTTTFILLAVFSTLMIISICIHVFATANIRPHPITSKSTNNLPIKTKDALLKEQKVKEKLENKERDENQRMDHFVEEKAAKVGSVRTILRMVYETLLSLIRQLKSPKQLLLAGLQFYTGMQLSFVMVEISRAYVSCILGVQQVGLAMMVFGTVACLGSYVNGKVAARFGRNIPLCITYCLDMAGYIFCIFWVPTEHSTWIPYVLCAVFGYTAGVGQSLSNAMCAAYFKKEREVAFTMWNMFVSCGIALQFGWSAHLCVYSKMYASMIILGVSYILYVIAELIYQRTPSKKVDISDEQENITQYLKQIHVKTSDAEPP